MVGLLSETVLLLSPLDFDNFCCYVIGQWCIQLWNI